MKPIGNKGRKYGPDMEFTVMHYNLAFDLEIWLKFSAHPKA